MLNRFSCVRLCATLWTVAHQAPLSMGILQARILEWVAMTSPGDLPNPEIEPRSPALQADSLPTEPPGKPPKLLKNLSEVELGDQKGELSCPAIIAEPNTKKGEGNGTPLQYSCLENPMDGGA